MKIISNQEKSFDCCCHLKSTVFPLGSASKIKRIKKPPKFAVINNNSRYKWALPKMISVTAFNSVIHLRRKHESEAFLGPPDLLQTSKKGR